MKDATDYLNEKYNECITTLESSNEIIQEVKSNEIKKSLDEILKHSESARGVLTVVLTSLVYKILNKNQDIRYHQANMDGGYSGRRFDTIHITPFLKRNNFPAMAESGWLTRSLEQNMPYDRQYPGKITPHTLKEAFLSLIDFIQTGIENENILNYILQYLILQRNARNIQLARPTNLSIKEVINKLETHFTANYSSSGAARLPVLSIQAVYSCLTNELDRYEGKNLLPLEEHTSADTRSGRIGDIEIVNANNSPFEAVEIKFGIEITKQLVSDAYSKFNSTQVDRYYILSTADVRESEKEEINFEIQKIKNLHGCQVIVNGVIKTLEYYLRLLTNTKDFINRYVELLEKDASIKFEHKEKWNDVINTE
jgi:DNA (cytosine-5)-methyltransferase 1